MSATLQLGVWGVMSLIPLALNWLAHRAERNRYVDSVGLSMMLVLFWAAYNIVITSPPGRPENMIPLVGLDVLGVAVAMAAWVRHRRVYKLLLAGLFIAQLIIHVAFWLAWNAWPNPDLLYTYMACLNGTFALQLLAVAFPGGWAIVRRYFSFGLSSGGRHLHLGSRRR